jgi:hypothetical protein
MNNHGKSLPDIQSAVDAFRQKFFQNIKYTTRHKDGA